MRIFTDRRIPACGAVFQSGAGRATRSYRSQKRHTHKGVTEKARSRTWILVILVHSLVNRKKLFSRLSQFGCQLLNTRADSMRCGLLSPFSTLRDTREKSRPLLRSRVTPIAAAVGSAIFLVLPGCPANSETAGFQAH